MQKQSIFLVGPMGSGKSTVGKLLAERLGYDFVDSDHEIEARTGVSIPHIFDVEGEAGFRVREKTIIEELSQRENCILATGGGVVLAEENRKALRSRGFVIYLKSSLESLILRTKNDRNRPLLQQPNPEKIIEKILIEREPFYQDVADLIIETQQIPAYKVVRQIHDKLAELGIVPNYQALR